jgi:hypothetical protein
MVSEATHTHIYVTCKQIGQDGALLDKITDHRAFGVYESSPKFLEFSLKKIVCKSALSPLVPSEQLPIIAATLQERTS